MTMKLNGCPESDHQRDAVQARMTVGRPTAAYTEFSQSGQPMRVSQGEGLAGKPLHDPPGLRQLRSVEASN